jgi:hypothetical protein
MRRQGLKYNFEAMRVGDVRYVTGVRIDHAQQAWYRYKKRHPELRDRQYQWWAVNGGIRIERVG